MHLSSRIRLHLTFYMLIILMAIVNLAFGNTINVPGDEPTIQNGIISACQGDTVLVQPGTYYEMLDFLGKEIVVRSVDGPGLTWIAGDSTDAVIVFDTWESEETVLSGFTVTGGVGHEDNGVRRGGAVYIKDASPTLEGNIFKWNSADMGGAIYSGIQGVTLLKNTFIGNSASEGGALFFEDGFFSAAGDTFMENEGWTGGVIDFTRGTLQVEGLFMENNKARNGACYYVTNGQLYSETSQYFKNAACEDGGVVWAMNSTINHTGDLIMSNTAGSDGGGVYLVDCTTSLDSTLFSCNTCVWHGGNGYFQRTSTDISRALVRRGEAASGGGLFFSDCNVDIRRTIIEKNAASLHGGGITASMTSVDLAHCTFDDNDAPEGGAVMLNSLRADISNSCFHGTRNGGALYANSSVVDLNYNDFFNNTGGDYIGIEPGATDIHEDPLFVNAESGGDYRLLNSSPCMDAGSPDETDPDGSRSDIGRFYFDQSKEWILYLTPDKYHIGLGETTWIEWTIIDMLPSTIDLSFDTRFVMPDDSIRQDMEGSVTVDPAADNPFSLQRFFYYDVPATAMEGVYRYQAFSNGDMVDECIFRIER